MSDIADQPQHPEPATTDHVAGAEELLSEIERWGYQGDNLTGTALQALAHAAVDIATSIRGLREDVQALTAAVREAADTGDGCTCLFQRRGSCEELLDEDLIKGPCLAEDNHGKPLMHERCPEREGGT